MLIRIAKEQWINTEHIKRISVYADIVKIALLENPQYIIEIGVNSVEGKALAYWLERNSNDIIKHYEGIRKDDNTN